MIDIVIVVTPKRLDELTNLLSSLALQKQIALINQVIICFNPIEEHSLKQLNFDSHFNNLKINVIGYPFASAAGARNHAVTYCNQNYILFLDSDMEISHDWIKSMHHYMENNPFLVAAQGMVFPKQDTKIGRFKHHYKALKTSGTFIQAYNHFRINPLLDTASLLIKREVFHEIQFDVYFRRQEDLVFSDDFFAKGFPFGINRSAIAEKRCNESLFGFLSKVFLDGVYLKKFEKFIDKKIPKGAEVLDELKRMKSFNGDKFLYLYFLFFLSLGFLFQKFYSNKNLRVLEIGKKYKPSKFLYGLIQDQGVRVNPYSRFMMINEQFIFNNFVNLKDLGSFNNTELSPEDCTLLSKILCGEKVPLDHLASLIQFKILLRQ